MILYQKLFGRILLKPLDDEGSAGGAGGGDRGDSYTPETPVKTEGTGGEGDDNDENGADDDLKTAMGDKEDQPRDDKGKFAKKEKGEDDEPRIPKSRYDEQIRKERERAEIAERRLAEFERGQQQMARTTDISKLEDQVKELRSQERKALVSGDDDKAAEFGSKADALNRQIAIEQTRDMTASAKEQAREEIRMELTSERIETEYPQLDEKSDTFDQDLTDDVLDKQRGYIERERLSPSQALLKAVKYVMSRAQPPAEKTEEKGGLSRADRGTERKEAAVAKNVDAANRQPASTKKAGADSDKHGQTAPTPEADQMTYEEFSALPDSTKAKMRGDFVA